MAAPWADETLPMPSRVGGERVVAGIKIPTAPFTAPHQWYVVLETSGGLWTVTRAVFHSPAMIADPAILMTPDYLEAVDRMVKAYRDSLL